MNTPLIPRRRVRDLTNNRVGEVMDDNREGDRLFLRPVGGGIEWEVPVDKVEDLAPRPEVGDVA